MQRLSIITSLFGLVFSTSKLSTSHQLTAVKFLIYLL
nr:MAG TPA: hypothetical protein [Caudoviricetes sp.]